MWKLLSDLALIWCSGSVQSAFEAQNVKEECHLFLQYSLIEKESSHLCWLQDVRIVGNVSLHDTITDNAILLDYVRMNEHKTINTYTIKLQSIHFFFLWKQNWIETLQHKSNAIA